MKCPIEECEKRDPKGLYKRQEKVILRISQVLIRLMKSEQAELIVETHKYSIEECAEQIVKYLQERSFI